jgi:hypothetical protein
MEKQKVNPESIVQTTSSVTQQTQTAQVIGSTVASATEALNTEDVAERSSDDSSISSEKAVPEDSAKSLSDDSVAEPPTAEKAIPNVPGDLLAAFEKINQQGLSESPFDDSESSRSQ